MASYPKTVRIVEVGARDGLQNEKAVIPIEAKIQFINMLSGSGLKTIEAGAFVSPKWVPQMADTDKVMAGIIRAAGVSYPVLVPNVRGMESAIESDVTEIAIFAAASETFSQKNINCTIAESLSRFEPVIEMARAHDIKVRGYISCVLGCPYEGDIDPSVVTSVSQSLRDMGCYEISLGDTIGTGTPDTTKVLLDIVLKEINADMIAVHFHDTYGTALANIDVALQKGIAVVDAAAGGLGGCPYAPGASGNVQTESVLAILAEKGIETGVDMDQISAASAFIRQYL